MNRINWMREKNEIYRSIERMYIWRKEDYFDIHFTNSFTRALLAFLFRAMNINIVKNKMKTTYWNYRISFLFLQNSLEILQRNEKKTRKTWKKMHLHLVSIDKPACEFTVILIHWTKPNVSGAQCHVHLPYDYG